MDKLTTRHGDIALIEAGNPAARPLLLLHNAGTDRRIWAPLMQALAPDYRLIAIDWPGYGESGPLEAGAVLDIYADVITDVIDAMALRDLVLVGNCVGSAAALHYCRRQAVAPAAQPPVTQLVLFNVLTHDTLTFASRCAAWTLTGRSRPQALKDMAVTLIGTGWGRASAVKFQLKAARNVPGPLRTALADRYRQPSNAGNLMRLGEQVIGSAAFAGLDEGEGMPPTQVIWGRQNRVLSATRGRAFVERYQPDEAHELSGGHLVMLEEPAPCAALIQAFLKAQPAHVNNAVHAKEQRQPLPAY